MGSALRRALHTVAATGLLLTGLGAGPAEAAVPPPTPGSLTPHAISGAYVTGVSSGGFMATQLHVAYSGTFHGAGIFTAGPYGCAKGNLTTAQLSCMFATSPIDLAGLEQTARDRAQQGRIDPLGNLSDDRVWVFHGTNDTTVRESVNDALAAFYTDFGTGVSYTKTSPAGHAWVSPIGPNACTTSFTPYLNNCGDDPERAMLGHLFGSAVAAPAGSLTGTLISFAQQAFTPGGVTPASISMGTTGFAYMPANCAGGASCRLVVALHGCLQSFDNAAIGNRFMDRAFLNEYADTNDMIVLYPQATATGFTGGNPNGCWNWWGYLGDTNYDVHGGRQIETIMAMVRALGG